MGKIKVYVSCCKEDYYFAKICVSSIRYWNPQIAVFLLKDHSKGSFDTVELEQNFNVGIVETGYKNLLAYIKLQPFYTGSVERIIICDADIVWMGDLFKKLQRFTEDMIVDPTITDHPEKEMNQWYFNKQKLKSFNPSYSYPGFLFNTGFFLSNTNIFRKEELDKVISWKEFPEPLINNLFYCQDQGILNYLVSEKIRQNSISVCTIPIQIWGWNAIAKKYKITDIENKIDFPYVFHWWGPKNGLTRFLPGSHVLDFFEKYYYSKIPGGKRKLMFARVNRTIVHLPEFMYALLKKIYYSIPGLPKKNDRA